MYDTVGAVRDGGRRTKTKKGQTKALGPCGPGPGSHACHAVHERPVHEKPGTNGISAQGQGSPMGDKHGPPTGRLQALPMHTGNLARRLESSDRGQSGRVGPWLAARRTWLTPTGHAIPTRKQ